jgi:hypothetical protein
LWPATNRNRYFPLATGPEKISDPGQGGPEFSNPFPSHLQLSCAPTVHGKTSSQHNADAVYRTIIHEWNIRGSREQLPI